MKLKMRAVFAPMMVVAAFAIGAGAAQAATITPPNTEVLGLSTNASLTVGGNTLSCSDSHVVGKTTEPASDVINITEITFIGCKNSKGLGETSATTNASSTCPFVLLATKATGGGNGEGTLTIPSCGKAIFFIKAFGFTVCEFVIAGPQTLSGWTFSNSEDKLTINFPASFVRKVGGAECGEPEGTGTFKATYSITPTNLEIN